MAWGLHHIILSRTLLRQKGLNVKGSKLTQKQKRILYDIIKKGVK